MTSELNGSKPSSKTLSISNKEIRKLTSWSLELKLCQPAVLMNRNRTEHQEKKVEETEEVAAATMIKMETTEKEVVAEEATAVEVAAAAVAVAATEIEVIETEEETEKIEEEEETTTEMEEAEDMMEEMATLEEEVATVEVEVGVAAAAVEVQVGTKAQATTTSTRNLITEIPTTMILLKAVALLIQVVINFQLLQPLLTVKIIVLKGITTLNPKINTNNLLDHHRLTQLFI